MTNESSGTISRAPNDGIPSRTFWSPIAVCGRPHTLVKRLSHRAILRKFLADGGRVLDHGTTIETWRST
jgi:hypothetical protein